MPGDPTFVSFTLRLPQKLVDALDEKVKKRREEYDVSFNRSRLIREYLKESLLREDWEAK